MIGGIPLILFPDNSPVLKLATAVFGIGLSLALDEWVYLITTDGSNMSYLLPISLWGSAVLVGMACLYIAILFLWFGRKG